MKYNVLERIVGELTGNLTVKYDNWKIIILSGPKPILYLTHSPIDFEMAQELVADLIANRSKQVTRQINYWSGSRLIAIIPRTDGTSRCTDYRGLSERRIIIAAQNRRVSLLNFIAPTRSNLIPVINNGRSAKLLDSTDEALILFKNFSNVVGNESSFRPDEVHKLIEFFRK